MRWSCRRWGTDGRVEAAGGAVTVEPTGVRDSRPAHTRHRHQLLLLPSAATVWLLDSVYTTPACPQGSSTQLVLTYPLVSSASVAYLDPRPLGAVIWGGGGGVYLWTSPPTSEGQPRALTFRWGVEPQVNVRPDPSLWPGKFLIITCQKRVLKHFIHNLRLK